MTQDVTSRATDGNGGETDMLVPAGDSRLGHYEDRLRYYLDQSTSERTQKEYKSDWKQWTRWCDEEGVRPLPARPVSVACFCVAMADRGLALSTIRRRLVAIRRAHQRSNEPDPTGTVQVRAALDGIRHDPNVNSSGDESKAALRTRHIRAIIDMLQQHRQENEDDSLRALRDQMVVLVGFCGGLRRGELAGLSLNHLSFRDAGLLIDITRSKTDQTGEGHEVSIHRSDTSYCPVQTTRRWIDESGLETSDALVQSIDRWGYLQGGVTGRTIANIVKTQVEAIGLDPSRFSAHSLRSGFVTELKAQGEAEATIMEQTRHESAETLRRYDKGAARFRHDFTAALGL